MVYLNVNYHTNKIETKRCYFRYRYIRYLTINNMQSHDDVTTPYKLLNWIQKDKLNNDNLSLNHKAVHLLEQNPDKINWKKLSQNPNAIHLLEKNVDKIEWMDLSANPNAIHLLQQNIDKIDWAVLSANPNAIRLLEQNFD